MQHNHSHNNNHNHSHGGNDGHGHNCNHKPPTARFMFLSMGTMMARQMTQLLSPRLATAEGRKELLDVLSSLSNSEKLELFDSSKAEVVNMGKKMPPNMPVDKLPLMSTQTRSVLCKFLVKKLEEDSKAFLEIPFILIHLAIADHRDAILANLAKEENDSSTEMDIDEPNCHPDVRKVLNFYKEMFEIPAVKDESFQKVHFEVLRYFLGIIVIYAQNNEQWMSDDDVSGQHGHSHNGQPCHGHGQEQQQKQQQHGHSHNGQPCHGHGGEDEEEEEEEEDDHHGHSHSNHNHSHSHGGEHDDDEDCDDDSHSHSHSHSQPQKQQQQQQQQQHSHSHSSQPKHSHSHNGVQCHGHGEQNETSNNNSNSATVTHICANKDCGKVADKLCSRCKSVAYCSRECQLGHWKEHKKNCKAQE